MDEIRSWLYIGKYGDTVNISMLRQQSIGAMLQLAAEVKHGGITSIYLPVEDEEPLPHYLIEKGVLFVRLQKNLEKRVLVACGAGINRSSAFCTAVLKEEEQLGLFDAFKEIKRVRPLVMPHRPVWESLCNYYGEVVPYEQIMSLE